MASSLDSLSNAELRQRLLEHGYDIPVSLNKEFLIRKLESILSSGGSPGSGSSRPQTRKSMPARMTPKSDAKSKPPNAYENFPPSNTKNTISTSSAYAKANTTTSTNSSNDENDNVSRRTSRGRSSIASPSVTTRTLAKAQLPVVVPEREPEPELEPISANDIERKGRTSNIRPSPLKRARPSSPPRLEEAEPSSGFDFNFHASPTPVQPRLKLSPRFAHYAKRTDNNQDTVEAFTKNKFGLIAAGRLVQTDFTPNDPVNPQKFVIEMPEAESVDYIVVFLTGVEEFPAGKGGEVFFGWPNAENEIKKWHKLGHISNIRQSAIFNISQLKRTISSDPDFGFFYGQLSRHTTAQIGISIEPLENILSVPSIITQVQLC